MNGRQRGVALISIMLVVVVATVLAVQMTTEQNLAVSRAATLFDTDQVRQYALGGEELARQILHEDFVAQPGKDQLAEAWASNDLHYEFEEGEVSLTITDLQGRLNINGLAGQDSGLTRIRLSSLLAHLGVDVAFVDRMADWVDHNAAKSAQGAEDFDYLGLPRPYRTAGGPMADPSELRLLLDMDDATYAAILPYVCALPDPGTTVNVNTAPPRVLQAIAPSLTDEAADALASQRDAVAGYDSVKNFLADPMLAGSGTADSGLGVQSSYFQVSVRARYHGRFAYLTSIVQRDPTDGSMRVIYRDLSKKIYPAVASDD